LREKQKVLAVKTFIYIKHVIQENQKMMIKIHLNIEVKMNIIFQCFIIKQSMLLLKQRENTVHDTQVQDTNQSASEIESSFDYHKVIFINNFSATLDLMTLKENKYRSIECLFSNTSISESLSRRQNYDE